MTINVNCPPRGLFIGHETENGARALTVDFSAWAAEYSTGTLQILFQRPGTESPYAVVLTRDGTTATWKPSETDLAEAGTGAVQIIYTVGDVRVKTSIIPVMVEPSLGVETDPPEGWTSWIDQLTDLAAETEQHAASAAESAENAGTSATGAQRSATDAETAKNASVEAAEAAAASASHYPQIVGGVWYVWSPTAGEYISTGIDAQGEDGVSPTVEITAIQGGHRVVITDAEGPHEFDVLDGVTPDLSAYRTAADQDVIDGEQDEELNNLKSAIEDLTTLVDRKAGMLVDTASGAIASFVPDATVPNLLGVTVDIEPVQDLHGQDSPWPAGGGLNLLYQAQPQRQTINGVEWSINEDGSISANGTATSASTFVYIAAPDGIGSALDGDYKYINFPSVPSTTMNIGVKIGGAWASLYSNVASNITGADGKIQEMWFQVRAGQTANNITIYPMIYPADAQTPSAWTPYSNICPISGRESVEVEAIGENWVDIGKFADAYHDYCTYADNVLSVSNVISAMYSVGIPAYAPAGAVVNAKIVEGTATNVRIRLMFEGGMIRDKAQSALPFTTPRKLVGIRFNWSAAGSFTISDFSVAIGSAEYKPYSGNRYTIQLGDTVYGGTLDVTNGTLTVDRAMVDMGSLAWVMYQGFFFVRISDRNASSDSLLCSGYPYKGIKADSGMASADDYSLYRDSTAIKIKDTSYTSLAAFKNGVSGYQLVYELATPIVIDLDPVTVPTIAGQLNNLWSDAGDVSVEFAADLKAYIDSKIAAAVAALS